MARMARKRYIPRSKRWRAERMRQGPGRGGKGDPTGTLDLLAQDLRTWLHKKKVERGRRAETENRSLHARRAARFPLARSLAQTKASKVMAHHPSAY